MICVPARVLHRLIALTVLATACLVLVSPQRAIAQITSCDVSSTGIVFSNYDLLTGAAVASTGDLEVTCSGSGSGALTTVLIDLSAGSGTCLTRTMTSGANTLQYNVYTSAAHATAWCAPITQSYTFNFGASPQTYRFTLYGLVAPGQVAVPGAYSDSLIATVTWPGGTGATTSVAVTQNAPAVCSLTAGNLNFGTYVGISSDATANISVICSLTSPYSVAMNGGDNLSGTMRRMVGPSTSFIGYDLFSDAARTTAWGDGTGLGAAIGGTGTGTTQSLTVYGRTRAGALPAPGAYSDTVVVTLTY